MNNKRKPESRNNNVLERKTTVIMTPEADDEPNTHTKCCIVYNTDRERERGLVNG